MKNKNSDIPKLVEAPRKIPQRLLKGAGVLVLAAASYTAGTLHGGSEGATHQVAVSTPTTTERPTETTISKIDKQAEKAQQEALEKMQSQIDELTEVVAAQAGVRVEVINGSLPGPESLPGYGTKVSPEQRETLEGSVLKMGKRLKGTEDPWTEVCTANKVSVKDNNYVLTAAHCLIGDLQYQVAGRGGGGATAVDITEASPFEYAFLNANIPSAERILDPVTTATLVSMSVGGSDFALFTVNDTPNFSAMPSFEFTDTGAPYTPGIQVRLRSLPQASGNEPVETTGIYLGAILDDYTYGGISTAIDVVGVKGIEAESEDPCMYGASGSSAITAEGPVYALSSRLQVSKYKNGTVDAVADPFYSAQQALNRADILNVDLSEFDTLCGYARPLLGDVNQLLNPIPYEAVAVESTESMK